MLFVAVIATPVMTPVLQTTSVSRKEGQCQQTDDNSRVETAKSDNDKLKEQLKEVRFGIIIEDIIYMSVHCCTSCNKELHEIV